MRSLYESLLDDEDDVIGRGDNYVKVKQWCDEHLDVPENRWEYKDGKIDVNGRLQFKGLRTEIPEYIKFREVKGGVNFGNREYAFLQNLHWFPEIVHDNVYLYNSSVTSFKNIPLKLVGGYMMVGSLKVKSFEGLENVHVQGEFNCSGNKYITSLKGMPKKVDLGVVCSNCSNLVSLEGAPEEVQYDFDCSNCSNLVSLEGAPKKVGRDFICEFCTKLKTLEGAPKKVGREFNCIRCEKLESLEGAPEEAGKFVGYGCFALDEQVIKDFKKKRKGGKYKYRMQIK